MGREKVEVFGVGFGVPVLRYPVTTNGEFVAAQHVDDGHATYNSHREIRALHHPGAHQQAPIAASANRQLGAARIFFGDHPLSSGDKIIEDILLLLQHTRVGPLFTVFAATTQVSHSEYAAVFDPQEGFDGEDRSQADIKASVTKEQRWIVAVQRQPFLVREKHWHAGAVSARLEDLRRLVARRVEVQAYIPEQG